MTGSMGERPDGCAGAGEAGGLFSGPAHDVHRGGPTPDHTGRAYRRAIWAIAGGILAFGTLECLWALSLGSRQPLKDALAWAYDVALYGIAAVVFGRGPAAERASALAIAAILAVGGLHTAYDLWDKVVDPRPIEPLTIGVS